MRLDTKRDGFHAFPISGAWKEVTNGVDAVFSYSDKMYLIKVGTDASRGDPACFILNTELTVLPTTCRMIRFTFIKVMLTTR